MFNGGKMSKLRTHLYEFHKKHARLTDFAGFEMPLWYEGIVPEHMSVRNSVGVFDVTHMGRYLITGSDSTNFLNFILTRNVSLMDVGQGRYSLMCNEVGGIIDDVFVFRLEEEKFLIVCNASNREKDYSWMKTHVRNFSVKILNISNTTAMFAVQGPKSLNTLQLIMNSSLSNLSYNSGRSMEIDDLNPFVSRTGYTGEDGFELLLWDCPLDKPEKAYKLWNMILEAGKNYGIKPCGLGARDTLRIEAGFCLYGNDINETITPLEAKLEFAVHFEKSSFIGKEALLKQKSEGIKRIRVGFRLLERGVPRPKYKILLNNRVVGEVTSGTFSPLLRCGIGMGYVPPENANPKSLVNILIRGKKVRAEIVDMPFYDTMKYGRKRKLK